LLPEPASLEDFDRAVGRALAIEAWLGGDRGRALLARMEHLPAMPSLYAQVMAELRKDDPSIEAVAAEIAKDPALTAKMLQTVNSPIFALRRPVGTAYEAVTFLGAERTKALILMASLSLHGSLTRCEGFSQENFWQHSLSVATWARVLALAEMKDASEADQAFTAGILHDVGKLLFASNMAPEYGPVLAEALARGVPVHLVERETLGLDHGSLGAALLGTWGLPMRLLEAVAWHDEPAQSADQNYSLLTAVHVANALEYERKAGESGAGVTASSTPSPAKPAAVTSAGEAAAVPSAVPAPVPGITTPQLDWVYLARLGIDALVDRWRQLIGCRPQPKRP
jgi:putative nucleotidyltransferase with HDIG domain